METKKIQTLIESLTDNEDYQQELWIAYLCGNSRLSTALDTIKIKHKKTEQLQYKAQLLISHDFSPAMLQILESFTGYEYTILYLLILGYNTNKISEHCGLSLVRVKQAIHAIQTNKCWEKLQ